eukprot:1008145-Rhodomonas_salina.3
MLQQEQCSHVRGIDNPLPRIMRSLPTRSIKGVSRINDETANGGPANGSNAVCGNDDLHVFWYEYGTNVNRSDVWSVAFIPG